MSQQDDRLAYGHYTDTRGGGGSSSRGLGDTLKKLKDTYKGHHSPQPGQSQLHSYNPGQNHPGSQSVRS